MAQYYIPLVATPQIGGSGGGSGGGGVLVVNVTETDDAYVCDKTAGEIYAACPGAMFVRNSNGGMKTVEFVGNYGRSEEGEYAGAHAFVTYWFANGSVLYNEYETASAEEYPAIEKQH